MSDSTTAIVIPDMTLTPVSIDTDTKIRLEKWVAFLKSVSPQILVQSILDANFIEQRKRFLTEVHNFCADGDTNVEIEIYNFDPKDIVMYVSINKAFDPSIKVEYDIRDFFIFCNKDKAFCVQDGMDLVEGRITYDKKTFNPDYYSWDDRTNILLKFLSDEFKLKIPPFPVLPKE
jgi:hypothetical protein